MSVDVSKAQIDAAEAAFSKAAYALLGMGHNNFDLIKLMRVESNKVRAIRREARAKPKAEKAPKPATSKPAGAKVAPTATEKA